MTILRFCEQTLSAIQMAGSAKPFSRSATSRLAAKITGIPEAERDQFRRDSIEIRWNCHAVEAPISLPRNVKVSILVGKIPQASNEEPMSTATEAFKKVRVSMMNGIHDLPLLDEGLDVEILETPSRLNIK